MRKRVIPLLVAVFAVSLFATELLAQEVVRQRQHSEAGSEYLRSVRFRGINTDVVYYDPLAPAPSLDTSERPVRRPQNQTDSDWSGSRTVTIAVTAVVLTALAFLFFRYGGGISISLRHASENPHRPSRGTHAAGVLETERLPDSLDAVVQIKDRRRALVLLAQAALSRVLDAHGVLLQRSWTARDALRHIPREQDHLDVLRSLVHASERAHFGGRDVSEGEFRYACFAGQTAIRGTWSMTDVATTERARGPKAEVILIVVFVMLVLGVLWYALSQRQQVLRSSASGLDGLQVWLSSQGVSAQGFSGGWRIDQGSIGLLVLPIYDTLPGRKRVHPQTSQDLLLQQDENDLRYDVIREKAGRVDTLIALPKWRSGMRLTGLGHPVLRVEPVSVTSMIKELTGDLRARLIYADRPFTELPYQPSKGEELTAEIYGAQLLDSARCRPIIGRPGAMLLADCPLARKGKKRRVLILSDPDLLNNHGLRLGDNAFIARDLIRRFAGDRNVIIDYSLDNWLRAPRKAAKRERSWADLQRFFGPPFTLLWLGAGLALCLFLWRAALRYGPVKAENTAPGASKTLAIDARARLMRLSNQDGAMIREYANARVAATATSLLGPAHARHYAAQDAFLAYIRRRHPALAAPLAAALSAIDELPPRIGAAAAIQHVDNLERILEQITHDT